MSGLGSGLGMFWARMSGLFRQKDPALTPKIAPDVRIPDLGPPTIFPGPDGAPNRNLQNGKPIAKRSRGAPYRRGTRLGMIVLEGGLGEKLRHRPRSVQLVGPRTLYNAPLYKRNIVRVLPPLRLSHDES